MTIYKQKSQILKNRAKAKKEGIGLKIVGWLFLVCFLVLSLAIIGAVGVFYYVSRDLPKIYSLADYSPPIITTVFSDDDRKIGEFYNERRVVVPLNKIPERLKHAFIASEDSRFYKHKGVDLLGIVRAFFKNVAAGSIVQGGSTITQQVTRSFLLSREKSYTRKIKEAILAYRIEKTFSKDEILYLFLNQTYLGHGAYGVQAAAENYFGKSVEELTLAECAMLGGLPQAPSRYSPFRAPERAKQRQMYVIKRMKEDGYITREEATAAGNEIIDVKPRRNWYMEKVPIYTEHVRRYVEKKYGAEALYNSGLKIYTAVNIEMQKAAIKEVQDGLIDLDRRQGYRGSEKQLSEEEIEPFCQEIKAKLDKIPLTEGTTTSGVVIDVSDERGEVVVRIGDIKGYIPLEDFRWARKPNPELAQWEARVKRPSHVFKVGDVIEVLARKETGKNNMWELSLYQEPLAESALLCIEAETGLVKVMVGGRNFRDSKFNRAIQSRRQPGSAFKPIIYSAAIDKGYTPATVIIDSPIILKDTLHNFTWKPKNYGKKFYGPTLLREALAKSRNVVTIKILQDIGIDYCIEYTKRLGIQSELSKDLSVALGSSGISLLEIVTSYSVFANQGYLVDPTFVTKIVDRNGNILEEMNPHREKVIDKSTAYIITSLLEGVVQNGTGSRVKALNRPVAGKTGTTNNLYDAWFVGYTPTYITGVWVGFDDERSLGKGETGSMAATPIWLGFMEEILKDKPVRVFQVPEGVVFAKIDAETGLLPIPESKKTIFECFKEGTVPTEYSKKPDTITGTDDFFKTDI